MPSFTVRLRVGDRYLDLDEIKAQTPHMACEVVAGMHKRFAEWIDAAGEDRADSLTIVKGRCEKCRNWVLATDEYGRTPTGTECATCASRWSATHRPEILNLLPKPLPNERREPESMDDIDGNFSSHRD